MRIELTDEEADVVVVLIEAGVEDMKELDEILGYPHVLTTDDFITVYGIIRLQIEASR